MKGQAKIILTCDIEYKGKIVFQDKEIVFYADITLGDLSWDGKNLESFTVETWYSDDETYRANRDGYLYSTIIKEWDSDEAVECYDPYADFVDYTLLVKSEDYKNIQIDYSEFEQEPSDLYKAQLESEMA